MIMDLAMMGGSMNKAMMGGQGCGGGDEAAVMMNGKSSNIPSGNDVTESFDWIDGEMMYPSIGMVFELAFLKCHLLCLLKDGRFHKDDSVSQRHCQPA